MDNLLGIKELKSPFRTAFRAFRAFFKTLSAFFISKRRFFSQKAVAKNVSVCSREKLGYNFSAFTNPK